MSRLEEVRSDFIWAPVRALYDAPDKLKTNQEEVADHLIQHAKEKDHEVMIEAAYVIPGPEGVERARRNKEWGIRQRLLTNSLATNDVAAAHAGYAKYRRELIRNGVELHELRPGARHCKGQRVGAGWQIHGPFAHQGLCGGPRTGGDWFVQRSPQLRSA